MSEAKFKVGDTVMVPMKIVGVDPGNAEFKYKVDISFALVGSGTMWIMADAIVPHTPPPPPNTVPVRIAVAVDPDGRWNGTGWSESDDKEAGELALDVMSDRARLSYITAHVPLPAAPAEVEGRVE